MRRVYNKASRNQGAIETIAHLVAELWHLERCECDRCGGVGLVPHKTRAFGLVCSCCEGRGWVVERTS